MKAIIYLYAQDNFINITADRAESTEDFIKFYSGENLQAMFALTGLKGFYFSKPKEKIK